MNTNVSLPVDQIEVAAPRRPVNLSQVADLADSIRRVGLLQPLVVTHTHRLVAGRHRLEAVRKLGWKTVPVVVIDLAELEVRLAGLDENLIRADLSRLERFEHLVERADLLAALGKRHRPGRAPKADTVSGLRTTDEIAGESGLSGRTLQRANRIVGAIPEPVREKLRTTALADATTELLRLSRLPPDDQLAVVEKAASGVKGAVNDLLLLVKRERRQEEADRCQSRQPDDGENVHVGRFEELAHVIPDDGVALFICDPPYADVGMYGSLGRLAASKLRPGGWLAAYCSTHLMAEVMRRLGDHLNFFWAMSIRCTGVNKQHHGFRFRCGWKPVLIFQRPPRTLPPDWVCDFYFGGGDEKAHHDWEQPVSEARYMAERLTNPGDLVVDPTCGSGSALVGARQAGRKWLGIDLDPKAVQVARLRLRSC